MRFEGEQKRLVFVTNDLTGWKIAGTMLYSETEDKTASLEFCHYSFNFFLLSLAVLRSSLSFAPSHIGLRKLVDFRKVSEGDLTGETLETKSKDEIEISQEALAK
ncbi:hypothetical protein ACEQPO_23490 [Bacillus sp. SL00103]